MRTLPTRDEQSIADTEVIAASVVVACMAGFLAIILAAAVFSG